MRTGAGIHFLALRAYLIMLPNHSKSLIVLQFIMNYVKYTHVHAFARSNLGSEPIRNRVYQLIEVEI